MCEIRMASKSVMFGEWEGKVHESTAAVKKGNDLERQSHRKILKMAL